MPEPITVSAFTDTYLPTVNGVSYAVSTWRERWNDSFGQMNVIYPAAPSYRPGPSEYPVKSVPFPFYEGYRIGWGCVPCSLPCALVSSERSREESSDGASRVTEPTPISNPVDRISDGFTSIRDIGARMSEFTSPRDADGPMLVHAHTPFSIGFAAMRYASRRSVPFVTSYHTPTAEFAGYVSTTQPITRLVRRLATTYERWFYDQSDLVVVPTTVAGMRVRTRLGVSTPIAVVSNGVDLDRFGPVDPTPFLERHAIDPNRVLVGYTGRHGHEKRLETILRGCVGLDEVTIVFGGDGPARTSLERLAASVDVDARFLGCLDRDDLPQLYSALDVFAFPSPVETEGLVALESIACGTPVVAVDAGALSETIDEGVTGYHFDPGSLGGFRRALQRVLEERSQLETACLQHRSRLGVDRSLDSLYRLYTAAIEGRVP